MNIQDNIQDNRQAILERQPHEKLWVQEGRLQKVQGFKNHAYYFLTKSSQEKKVKEAVHAVVQDNLDEELIQKVSKLSPRIFDRSIVEKEIVDPLEKVKFAEKLGVKMIPISTGANGSYFATDWKGEKLFVFKPEDEDATTCGSPKLMSRIKSLALWIFFLGGSEHPMLEPGSGCKNEVLASSLDKFLGTEIVPETTRETFYGKEGSCQAFRGGCRPARQDFGWFGKPGTIDIQSFQKMAILDYAIGNLDRHDENWLISKEGQVIAIDNGLAFGKNHPECWLDAKHQYDWNSLQIAHVKFQDMSEIKVKLKNIEDWKELKQLTSKQKETMQQRIDKLIQVLEANKTPADLAKFKYENDFAE